MVGPGRLGGDPKGRGTGTVLCESGSVRAGWMTWRVVAREHSGPTFSGKTLAM